MAKRTKVCSFSLLLTSSLWIMGCERQPAIKRQPAINGEFNVSYTWTAGRIENAVIQMEKPKESISDNTRNAVIETVQPYVADTMQASGLNRAKGQITVSISGTPPYFVRIGTSAITEPDFSELRSAVETENIDRIRQLVITFNNVNQRELPSRQTALAIAAVGGRIKSLQTLLALGADPNIADSIGVTPLMNAVLAGREETVTALVYAGANVATITKAGDSATSLAKHFGREKMLPLLAAKRR